MVDAFRLPDLRRKILFTLAILVIFRFIANVPMPGVDLARLEQIFSSNALLGMLDLFSGGAMRNMSIAAMGVYPYITASIIMQLMVPVIPQLRALSKEGETGRHKINQYTHWLTVPLAFLQGYGELLFLQSQGAVHGIGLGGDQLLPTMAMVISMTAGTVFLVWLGERITENGIGNGVSIIIFGGIVAGLPQMIGRTLVVGATPLESLFNFGVIGFVVLGVLTVLAIVIFQEAQRRIPVQYSRSLFRGGRMYRQAGATHIPMRVNMAGMIPLIFAMSIMMLPGTVATYFVGAPGNPEPTLTQTIAGWVVSFFNPSGFLAGWPYWTFYFLLVVGFTFFYTLVIFEQQNLAETLQKQGGFIPGIRPGRPTAEYLNRVLSRITWGGAIFLGLVAVAPFIVSLITGVQGLQLSSTSLLIVVGVALDTMRQLEAQLLMRRYEGLIR
jgi:preprotein translocase subunit SecY